MIAIGIGCRKNCGSAEIIDLIHRASLSAGVPIVGARLFTIAAKQGEAGLIEAASALDLPLIFLPVGALAQIEPATRSDRVTALFGIPSVAEASALAGAGPGAQLFGPRIASASATCAIATTQDTNA